MLLCVRADLIFPAGKSDMAVNSMPVFILFLVVPFVEIYLLVEIGARIGAPWTILLVVMTAIVGAWLVRVQGLATLRRFQASLARNELPATALVEGLCLLIAGALLLTPGFFTDAVGFACLIPPFRQILIRRFLQRSIWKVPQDHAEPHDSSEPLDGNYKRIDDK
jgi:UPF0716 protein FxsA